MYLARTVLARYISANPAIIVFKPPHPSTPQSTSLPYEKAFLG